MLSILPLVRVDVPVKSGPWRWSDMFHPAIAAAVAHERQTDLAKAAKRHREWRAAKAVGREIERRGR